MHYRRIAGHSPVSFIIFSSSVSVVRGTMDPPAEQCLTGITFWPERARATWKGLIPFNWVTTGGFHLHLITELTFLNAMFLRWFIVIYSLRSAAPLCRIPSDRPGPQLTSGSPNLAIEMEFKISLKEGLTNEGEWIKLNWC